MNFLRQAFSVSKLQTAPLKTNFIKSAFTVSKLLATEGKYKHTPLWAGLRGAFGYCGKNV